MGITFYFPTRIKRKRLTPTKKIKFLDAIVLRFFKIKINP